MSGHDAAARSAECSALAVITRPIERPSPLDLASSTSRSAESRSGATQVEVARLDTAHEAVRIDVRDQADAVQHRDGEGLRAAHPAAAGGDHQPAGERATEALFRDRRERLVRALHDALRADVDPRARGHLPVHRETERLEPPELVPGRPVRHQVRVREQHPGRHRVRAEDARRPPRLDEQRLVVAEPLQGRDDPVVVVPGACGLAGATVDDEVGGILRDVRIEVVLEHPERRFLQPSPAPQLGPARGADDGCIGHARERSCGGERLPSSILGPLRGCSSVG